MFYKIIKVTHNFENNEDILIDFAFFETEKYAVECFQNLTCTKKIGWELHEKINGVYDCVDFKNNHLE